MSNVAYIFDTQPSKRAADVQARPLLIVAWWKQLEWSAAVRGIASNIFGVDTEELLNPNLQALEDKTLKALLSDELKLSWSTWAQAVDATLLLDQYRVTAPESPSLVIEAYQALLENQQEVTKESLTAQIEALAEPVEEMESQPTPVAPPAAEIEPTTDEQLLTSDEERPEVIYLPHDNRPELEQQIQALQKELEQSQTLKDELKQYKNAFLLLNRRSKQKIGKLKALSVKALRCINYLRNNLNEKDNELNTANAIVVGSIILLNCTTVLLIVLI